MPDSILDGVQDLENPGAVDGDVDGHVKDPVVDPPVTDPNKKPDGDKDADSTADADEPKGAPEEYEDFTLPEGVERDEAETTKFKEFAKENGLTQKQAQSISDSKVEAAKKAVDSNMKLWEDQNNEWKAAARADKEYGGLKFEENLGVAKKAMQKFGTTELLQVVDNYGMGNHPEFIRLLVRVGKAMSEDGMITGVGSNPAPKSAADILFPNQGN